MKKIKLMALGLMVMMIQSVGAVTLPSTSYSGGSAYGGAESVVFSSGSMVTGSYSALGSGLPSGYQEQFDACVSKYPTPGEWDRTNCCESVSTSCANACGTDYECIIACGNANISCVEAGSLPLDGGLSILLVLALGSGAVRMFRKK